MQSHWRGNISKTTHNRSVNVFHSWRSSFRVSFKPKNLLIRFSNSFGHSTAISIPSLTRFSTLRSLLCSFLTHRVNQLVVGGYYKEAERVLLHSLKVFSQLEEWPLRDSFCKLHSEFVLPALQREEQTISKSVLPSPSPQSPLPEIEIVQSSSTLSQSQTSSLSSSTTSASLGTFRSHIAIVGNVLKTFFQKQGVWMFLSSVITCVMIASALWRRSETRSLPFQRRRRSSGLTEQFWRSFRSLFSMAGRRSELL